MENHLGEGAFGLVFKGMIQGTLRNPKLSQKLKQRIGLPIAVKLLKGKYSYIIIIMIGNKLNTEVVRLEKRLHVSCLRYRLIYHGYNLAHFQVLYNQFSNG